MLGIFSKDYQLLLILLLHTMVAKWTLNYLCALSIRPLFSLLWVLGHMQSWGVHLIVFWQYIRGKATMVGKAKQLHRSVCCPDT